MPNGLHQKHVLLMAGPTASGKSSLSVKLAKMLDGVIINADSMQVYAGLRVLSARPSPSEEDGVPHRLFGVIDPATAFSTADWHTMAMAEIEAAWAKGKFPILVGGTGLYFKSLLKGMAPIAPVDEAVRQSVRDEMQKQGAAKMHEALQKEDPVLAARLKAGDSQRIARGLEVARSTGRPLSDWQSENDPGGLSEADAQGRVFKAVMDLPREVLYARINSRFMTMVDEGALDEVRALLAQHIDPAKPLMKALGVPEFALHLKGDMSLAQAIEVAQMQTRRYAKRQTTWFNNQFADWHRIDALDEHNAQATFAWMEGRCDEGL